MGSTSVAISQRPEVEVRKMPFGVVGGLLNFLEWGTFFITEWRRETGGKRALKAGFT